MNSIKNEPGEMTLSRLTLVQQELDETNKQLLTRSVLSMFVNQNRQI